MIPLEKVGSVWEFCWCSQVRQCWERAAMHQLFLSYEPMKSESTYLQQYSAPLTLSHYLFQLTISKSQPSRGLLPPLKISHSVAPKLHLSHSKVRLSGTLSISGATQGILSRITKKHTSMHILKYCPWIMLKDQVSHFKYVTYLGYLSTYYIEVIQIHFRFSTLI